MALVIFCADFTYATEEVIGPGAGLQPPPKPTPEPPEGTKVKGFKIEGAQYYDYVGIADDGSIVDKFHIIFGHLGGMLGIGGESDKQGSSSQNSSGPGSNVGSNNSTKNVSPGQGGTGPEAQKNANTTITPNKGTSGPEVSKSNPVTDFIQGIFAPTAPPTSTPKVEESVSPNQKKSNTPNGQAQPDMQKLNQDAEMQRIEESRREAEMMESVLNSMVQPKDSPDRMKEEETTIHTKETTAISAPTAESTKEKETNKETTKSKFNFFDMPIVETAENETVTKKEIIEPKVTSQEVPTYQSTGPSIEPTTRQTEKPTFETTEYTTENTIEYTENNNEIEETEVRETTAEETVEEEEELKEDEMSDEELEEEDDSKYTEEKGEEASLGEDKGDNDGKNTGIRIFEIKNTDGNFDNKPIESKVGFNNMQRKIIFGICGGIFLLGFFRFYSKFIIIRYIKNKYII